MPNTRIPASSSAHTKPKVLQQASSDPLTACLDANGTYICTAYNPRCFIIQKVTPGGLNPHADTFEHKQHQAAVAAAAAAAADVAAVGSTLEPWGALAAAAAVEPALTLATAEGYVYMNGDIEKIPPGVAFAPTPELVAATGGGGCPSGGAAHSPDATSPANNSSSSTAGECVVVNGVSDEACRAGSPATMAAGGTSTSPSGAVNSTPTPDIPLDQLKQMLSSQLEYYFSRENLANDTYLLSQMDNDQYVPIWTVANFNQVKKLTKDIKLITDVLRESPNVQVDEEGHKVRPNHKRCIVILREIPENTPAEEIKGLFSGENCPKCISCEFAHNNSWYTTFESDEDAQRAYRFLREEVREFQGKPIMARIKAKPMNRLPIPATVPAVPGAPGPSGGPMKNGFRSPPVYETAGFPGTPRYVYSNGSGSSPMPPGVSYPNQVHVLAFQQQPPSFYPQTTAAAMLPWAAAANQAFYDIGSVFTVNGLAPQSPFPKPQNSKFAQRSSRAKRSTGGGSDRSSLPDTSSGTSRQSAGSHSSSLPLSSTPPATSSATAAAAAVAAVKAAENHVSRQEDAAASSVATQRQEDERRDAPAKDTGTPLMQIRPRRRRKEDESRGSGSTPRASANSPQPASPAVPAHHPGPRFDLEATAFPPLPGMDSSSQEGGSKPPAPEQPEAAPPPSPWESRLSDVVKGTAKPKPPPLASTPRDKDPPLPCPPPAPALAPEPPAAPVKPPAAPAKPPASTLKPASPSPEPPPPSVPQQPTTQPKPQPPPQSQAKASHPQPAPQAKQQPHPQPAEKETREVSVGSDPPPRTVTPPSLPEKSVKSMADKSTKTDDALLNGELVCASSGKSSSESARPTAASVVGGRPATANASTMTSHVLTESRPTPSSPTPEPPAPPAVAVGSKLSYAQVAQHHRERAERLQREKQAAAQAAAQVAETDKRKSEQEGGASSRQPELRGERSRDVGSLPQRDGARSSFGRGISRTGSDRGNGPSNFGSNQQRPGASRRTVERTHSRPEPRSPK